jgi:uncharacterized damage-inducible protein DinB
MNLEDLRTLLDYHYWARDRMLEALDPLTSEQLNRDMGNSFKSIRDTVTHLYAAEWVWYSRWHGTSPASLLATDTFADLAALRREWTAHEAKMRAFLEDLGEAGIDRVFEFTLFSGLSGAQPFWQMLQHVTTMLRQLGAPPPKSLDMVAFYRDMAAKS